MTDNQGNVSMTKTVETSQYFVSTKSGSFKPAEAFRKELIEAGWTPPPEKKIFEGDVKLSGFNGHVLYVTYETNGAYLDNRNFLDGLVGKRVRLTVEELRDGGTQ